MINLGTHREFSCLQASTRTDVKTQIFICATDQKANKNLQPAHARASTCITNLPRGKATATDAICQSWSRLPLPPLPLTRVEVILIHTHTFEQRYTVPLEMPSGGNTSVRTSPNLSGSVKISTTSSLFKRRQRATCRKHPGQFCCADPFAGSESAALPPPPMPPARSPEEADEGDAADVDAEICIFRVFSALTCRCEEREATVAVLHNVRYKSSMLVVGCSCWNTQFLLISCFKATRCCFCWPLFVFYVFVLFLFLFRLAVM